MFGVCIGLMALLAALGEPGYAILPIGVGIMINGQIGLARTRPRNDDTTGES